MLSVDEKIEFLKNAKLFEDASTDDLGWIAKVVHEVSFEDDQDIFLEGDIGDALYIVVSGQVKIHFTGTEFIRRVGGECFGEMAIIDSEPRSASATSVGDTVLLKMDRDDFYRAIQGNVRMIQNVLKTLVGRLRDNIKPQIEAARMIQDITRAREMQTNILPVDDLTITYTEKSRLVASGCFFPAEKVVGDYYDYFALSDHQVGLVIGDVMGHGFHTGLLVFTAKSCLHTLIKFDYSIPSVMSVLNDRVCRFVRSGMFMTLCYAIVDLRDRTVSFSNAGHNYPYHYRASTKQLELLESDTCPLGIMDTMDYDVQKFDWDDGDIFVLYTDGIVEAQNKSGIVFGTENLERLILEYSYLDPFELKETILRELNKHCQSDIYDDDISMIIVKMG